MKKILSCVMALSIAACAAMSASADQTLNEGSTNATVPVTYNIKAATYSVTIPDSVTLTDTSAKEITGISYDITGGMLAHGQALKLSVANGNDLKLYCPESSSSHEHYVSCAVYKDGQSGVGTKVSATEVIATATESGSVSDLYIDDINTTEAKCSGDYTGNITFSVEVSAVSA